MGIPPFEATIPVMLGITTRPNLRNSNGGELTSSEADPIDVDRPGTGLGHHEVVDAGRNLFHGDARDFPIGTRLHLQTAEQRPVRLAHPDFELAVARSPGTHFDRMGPVTEVDFVESHPRL